MGRFWGVVMAVAREGEFWRGSFSGPLVKTSEKVAAMTEGGRGCCAGENFGEVGGRLDEGGSRREARGR